MTKKDIQQCLKMIDFIENQGYELWSENLDLKDKLEFIIKLNEE